MAQRNTVPNAPGAGAAHPAGRKLDKGTALRLMKYITGTYKLRFVGVLIFILLSSAASVAGSLFLQILIDDYIGPLLGVQNPVFTGLLWAIGVMGLIYLCGVLSNWLYQRQMAIIGQGVQKRIRDEMFERMQALPMGQSSFTLEVLELATGSRHQAPFKIPTADAGVPIGGLAFNAASGRVYYHMGGHVWAASPDEAFECVASLHAPFTVGETPAWVLDDGRYGLHVQGIELRSTNQIITPTVPLTLSCIPADGIYDAFIQHNPNIPVVFVDEWLTLGEIAQLIAGGDQSVDIYCRFFDNTFHEFVQKGYAAPLGDSSLLLQDIGAMYPSMQAIFTDENGIPVAYPHELYRDGWLVDEGLWFHCFGDRPIPETYGEFFDAMLYWESELAGSYPEFDFVMNFDHPYFIRLLLNAYARYYEVPGEKLLFDRPQLIAALTALEQAASLRAQAGRSTRFIDEDVFTYRPEIFTTASFYYALMERYPAPEELLPTDSTGSVAIGRQLEMDALVFEKGDSPHIQGKPLVLFVNPNSTNKSAAILYLECAANAQNAPRTYYATHPDMWEPVEMPGYEKTAAELTRRSETLTSQLVELEGVERMAAEDELFYAKRSLEELNRFRWLFSAETLEKYRKIAPSIRFYENNLYVVADASALKAQLDGLYNRYADGQLSLELFLFAYEERLLMYYDEQ